MITNERRYVIIPSSDISQVIRESVIPYGGTNYSPTLVTINGVESEILKWRDNKPSELWVEFPVYSNEEVNDYILTNAVIPPLPQQL